MSDFKMFLIILIGIQLTPAFIMISEEYPTFFLWIRENFIFKISSLGRLMYSIITILYIIEVCLLAFPLIIFNEIRKWINWIRLGSIK